MPNDYGTAHRRVRRARLPYAWGTPCSRCGELMVEGQKLHLDHTDDGLGYLGFSHERCNVSAAAKKGNTQRAADARAWRAAQGDRSPLPMPRLPEPVHSRAWWDGDPYFKG